MTCRGWSWLLFALLLPISHLLATRTSQQFQWILQPQGEIWSATLSWRGGTLLRLRSPDRELVQSTAAQLTARLEQLALQGVRPQDWSLARSEGRYRLQVGGGTFLELTRQWLDYSRSDPEALARQWLQHLQQAFATPYLALAESEPLEVPVAEWTGYPLAGTAQGTCQVRVEPQELVQARYDEDSAILYLQGLTRGDGWVYLERQQAGLACPLRVRPRAARWLRDPVLEWTGLPFPALMETAWRQSVLTVLDLRPGAVWRWGTTLPSGPAPSEIIPPAFLQVMAPDCFPVTLRPQVALQQREWQPPPTRSLMLSNSPENVKGSVVLAQALLAGDHTARWMVHHKNTDSQSLQLELRLENPDTAWRPVFLRPAFYGPNRDEIYAGHRAMRLYWDLLRGGSGYFLRLPPRSSVVVYGRAFRPGEILSSIGDLAPLEGPVRLVVLTTTPEPEPSFYRPLLREVRVNTPLFAQTQKTLKGEYTVGHRFLFFSVGREPVQAENGDRLAGNYGVLYELQAALHNPTPKATPMQVVFSADGGVGRGVLWVDGRVVETGMVAGGQETPVHRFTLEPGQKRHLTVRVIPQAGSHYPLRIVIQPVH